MSAWWRAGGYTKLPQMLVQLEQVPARHRVEPGHRRNVRDAFTGATTRPRLYHIIEGATNRAPTAWCVHARTGAQRTSASVLEEGRGWRNRATRNPLLGQNVNSYRDHRRGLGLRHAVGACRGLRGSGGCASRLASRDFVKPIVDAIDSDPVLCDTCICPCSQDRADVSAMDRLYTRDEYMRASIG